MNTFLTIASIVFGFASAAAWLRSSATVSLEREQERRKRKLLKAGKEPNFGSVHILDGDTTYDLIGTLRHQSVWSRIGAAFAAFAMLCQALATWIGAPPQ